VRIDKKSEKLYFTQTFDGAGFGYVYTLPLKNNPVLSDLKLFHKYQGADTGSGPDGIAFGKSGNLYVALAGTSKISVLRENGTEETKYSGPAQNPGNPAHNPLPWANPANIAFNKKTKSLLVTNHASLTGLPDPSFLFAIFDVYVKDKAEKLFKDDDDD
jgi:DNA-binding beta-propeller fold protein YncE